MRLQRAPAVTGDRRARLRRRLTTGDRRVAAAYGGLALALVFYSVSVVARGGHYSTALDGWLVDAIEICAASLCLLAARGRRHLRVAFVCLGAALMCWALGDCALTVESFHGATPPVPSVADGLYICFYPLAYAAAVLLMRSHLRGADGPSWLDGLVAGLGAAAVCSAFFFHGIVRSTDLGRAGTVTDLLYPIGDLLLFGLAVGGLAVVPKRGRWSWAALVGGMAVVAWGDVVNLFSSSIGRTALGNFIGCVAWPAATVLMSLAPRLYRYRGDAASLATPPGLVLPCSASICALGIVVTASAHQVDRAAIGLAAATLTVAGARALISMRALRAIGQERHEQSITDDLTGLWNRRYMSNFLHDYFDHRQRAVSDGRSLAFLFVDLDHFKEINDSFGHPAGDELLRQLGARLKSSLRAVDIPVRVGGDEFAVLLPDIDVAAALEVAHRLASLIGEPFSLGPVNTQIGASTGIAMALDAADPAELMWRADVAMYRAKQAGSGCALYGEVPIEAGGIRLVGQLQAALEQAELCLHYQPLLDLSSGHIVGAEALLRWPHPELGMVPPLEFLPLAVEAGLMPHLTRFVLAQALGQVARWRAGGHNLSVSVNIWPSDLLEDGFVGTVDQLLVENSVGPEALVLEITEAAIKDFARSREVVEALTERGVMVSIDDFGAGATSLAYIGELRGIGELKLDRGFITDIGTRQRDLDIVRATIELGHAMGMRVVAEGIEDGETLDVLRSLGCDIAQGYYIGRPQPAERLDLGGVTELTSVLAPAHR